MLRHETRSRWENGGSLMMSWCANSTISRSSFLTRYASPSLMKNRRSRSGDTSAASFSV